MAKIDLDSSCLSIRPQGKFGSDWTDFHKIGCFRIFIKSVEISRFDQNLTRKKGTFH